MEPTTTTQAPEVNIGEELSRAWQGVSGSKASYWGATGLIFIPVFVLAAISAIMFGTDPKQLSLGRSLFSLLESLVCVVLGSGVIMMGIRRARGEEIKALMVAEQLPKAIPLIVISIFMWIAVLIGFLLLIIPGIYLSIGYIFALALLVDKGLKPWDSMETSRKLVTTKWFNYFAVMFLFGFIMMISAIPLGIGLIWTVPMGYNLLGNLYTKAFDRA